MAISQTMSNPSDWISQPYQIDFSDINQAEAPPTMTPATTTTAIASRNNNLSPDQGRVAKPIRRRSRASRRTPTTLLNTDSTNFRAMVQQFTGAPTAPFAARSQIPNGGGALNYMAAANAAVALPENGFRHVQYYPNQVLQQAQQHMFVMDNLHGRGGGGGGLPPQAAEAPPGSSSAGEDRDYNDFMLRSMRRE